MKSKNSAQHLFGNQTSQRQRAPRAARVAPQTPSPRTTFSIPASSLHSFGLCLGASVLSLLVHSLATCVIRSLLLHFMPFQLKKGFTGKLYSLIVGETSSLKFEQSLQPDKWHSVIWFEFQLSGSVVGSSSSPSPWWVPRVDSLGLSLSLITVTPIVSPPHGMAFNTIYRLMIPKCTGSQVCSRKDTSQELQAHLPNCLYDYLHLTFK